MSGIFQELKQNYRTGGAHIRLLYVNGFIFLVISLAFLFSGQPDYFRPDYWFSLPSVPEMVLIKPWTLITYMFYHRDIFHILFNMLNLFWFGKIFLLYFDEKKLVTLYFLGGIAGGIFYLLFTNLFPGLFGHGILMGASAAIIALMFASAFYAPQFKIMMLFFGEVKLIYIAIFSLFLYIVMLNTANAGGNLAHLGGALFGYLWVKQYLRGRDFSGGINKGLHAFLSLFKRKKLKVTYKKPVSDMEYNRQKTVNQKEIDRILDKISKAGYGSLSSEEKETLFRMSNQN